MAVLDSIITYCLYSFPIPPAFSLTPGGSLKVDGMSGTTARREQKQEQKQEQQSDVIRA